MNLDNADEMWTDARGNRWIKTSIDKTDQHFLNTVRKNWMEVSDDDILKAKDEQHAKEIENNKKIAQEKHNLELKLMEKKAAKIAEDKLKLKFNKIKLSMNLI